MSWQLRKIWKMIRSKHFYLNSLSNVNWLLIYTYFIFCLYFKGLYCGGKETKSSFPHLLLSLMTRWKKSALVSFLNLERWDVTFYLFWFNRSIVSCFFQVRAGFETKEVQPQPTNVYIPVFISLGKIWKTNKLIFPPRLINSGALLLLGEGPRFFK